MNQAPWKRNLRAFFSQRAQAVTAPPSLLDLCLISGREPRLWAQSPLYEDAISSIASHLCVDHTSRIVEVGCASGFLAKGVAPLVQQYVGVDLTEEVLRVARRLGLPNASYRRADGDRLPFAQNEFDAAYCYDVFTNFPRFSDGEGIIAEMLRVIKPGRHALVGSIPDIEQQRAYERRVSEVMAELDERFGPVASTRNITQPSGWWKTAIRLLERAKPEILCFYFHRDDFVRLGDRLGAATQIVDIHPLNPYRGLRFNALYTKKR